MLILFLASWELAYEDGPTRVERKKLDTGLLELRTTTSTDVPAAKVAETFWRRREVKGTRKYTLIKLTDTEKVFYVQLDIPVIKDRDYTGHMKRYDDAANGLYQFDTVCDTTLGPPPDPDFIRVTHCVAHLSIERDSDGRTLITNVSSADPAGAVPKWMVNMLAPKASARFIEELVADSRR